MKIGKPALAAVLLASWLTAPGLAQQSDQELRDEIEALKQGQESIQRQIELKNEIEELKKGQAEIQKQLEELKKLVQSRPAAAPARPSGPNVAGKTFDLGSNPVKGESKAKLTLVEFTDYQ
jgi:protein-disulfide isomerase